MVKDKILHYEMKLEKRKRGGWGGGDHQQRDGGSTSASGATCSKVVLDNEQVFHFFNVLAIVHHDL